MSPQREQNRCFRTNRRFHSNHDFDRQIADKTGEDIHTISRLGFSLLGPIEFEERQTPWMIFDWDLLAASR